MSTNAYIGRPSLNGRGEGRYLHSDGYPTHTLVKLAEMIKRDGVETTLDVIIQTGDWSTIEADRTRRFPWHDGASYVLIPGYGVAFRTWSEPMDGETGESYEWAYIVHDDGRIFITHHGNAVGVIRAQHVTRAKAQRIEDGGML
jgi:hypothetical protein